MQSSDLTSMIRRKSLRREESLWLLSTLSELYTEGWLSSEEPLLIEIGLATLLNDASKWSYDPPDSVLLEVVVTLAAISRSPDRAYRLDILTKSRQHPWLLQNLRNTDLVRKLLEDAPKSCHEQLISLFFLVLYALIYRGSTTLAVSYFTITTSKGDLPFYTSALTAIAPSTRGEIIPIIVRMLLASQAQELASIIHSPTFYTDSNVLEELFQNYDLHIGASENTDPNIITVLLIPFGHLYSGPTVQNLCLELKNPSLQEWLPNWIFLMDLVCL